ncbi:FtsQ-type POTRA domain-containing protein [Bifidobacterium sp. ESL0784]|uniref:cell division protein FtsQ/DivIB n=1 Tax=Bifidobacterium sp. ESL0784 TaxID=2983231 RepID=UPI0023F82271|nr:FtsQ-type POTRA domain-containing protein [Bifidobacterium sp. ESL0784]MDF7641189.1 FtsQ-type POTRA domain-containing protein [Bifidobacterium sp. ESL0784]
MAGRRVTSSSSGKNGSPRRGRSSASSSQSSSTSHDEPMVNDFGVRTGRRGKTGHSDFRMGENSQNKSRSSRSRTKEDSLRQARSVASGTPVGDDTTVDARRAKRRASASKMALTGGKPAQSAGAQPSRNKKTVGFFHRRQSGRPKYGIDEPLTDTDDTSQPARSPRSASSANAATKSAPGDFVDARALKNEDLVGETLNQTSGSLGVAARPKVIDFNARLKERRRVSAFKTVTKVLATLVVLALLVALGWVLFFSPVFLLDPHQISVSGENQWVGKARVVSIADKQAGKSLLLVSSGDVEQELKSIPGVSMAKVEKVYPQAMKVTITAQEPAAMLQTPDGSETAVDGYGRVLNKVGNVSTKGIPVIEVNDVKTSLRDRSVQQALKVLGLLDGNTRGAITKVTAKTQDSITTELNGGQRVIVWGDASDMKLKKAVVDKIINDPTKIGDKHQVDVSAPLRPIIK